MKYVLIILFSLIPILILILITLLKIRKTLSKQIIKSDLNLQKANINNLSKEEKQEILNLTNFLKKYNFTSEEDYIFKNDATKQELFFRILRNYEDATFLRIVCKKNVSLKKSVTLINITSENKVITSTCSDVGDLLPKLKNQKGSFIENFNELDKLIAKHRQLINKETLNKNFINLSVPESEKFINEIIHKQKVEEGLYRQEGNIYYNTNKSINTTLIKSLKNIFSKRGILKFYYGIFSFNIVMWILVIMFPSYLLLISVTIILLNILLIWKINYKPH